MISIRIVPGLLGSIVCLWRDGQWANFELTPDESRELTIQAKASENGLGMAATGGAMMARYMTAT